MARARARKNGAPLESSIEKGVWDWIRCHKVQRDCFKITNEGKRSWSEGKRLKSQGLTAGAVDLMIMKPSHGFPGAFIEFKTKGGKLQDNQREFLANAHRNGYFTGVIWDIDAAIHFLDWWFK